MTHGLFQCIVLSDAVLNVFIFQVICKYDCVLGENFLGSVLNRSLLLATVNVSNALLECFGLFLLVDFLLSFEIQSNLEKLVS